MALTQGSDYNANNTSGNGVQPLFTPVLNRYVLSVAKPNLVFSQFAQKAKIQKGKGKIVAWDRYVPLDPATTPLEEGVVPTGSEITLKRITEEPLQYGNYVATTDEFDFYKYDPSPEVLKIGELLGDNAAETFDSLTCDAVAQGTNVIYSSGKSSRSALTSDDKITLEDIRKAVRTLKNNKARKYNGKHFVCILDPDTSHDLQHDELWENVKIHDPKDLYEGELGELFGVRFVEASETEFAALKQYNATAENPVHAVFVFGQDAYGAVDEKENVETITHSKNEIGGPLNQFGTMGWKGHHVAKVLTDEWLVRIECGVSA